MISEWTFTDLIKCRCRNILPRTGHEFFLNQRRENRNVVWWAWRRTGPVKTASTEWLQGSCLCRPQLFSKDTLLSQDYGTYGFCFVLLEILFPNCTKDTPLVLIETTVVSFSKDTPSYSYIDLISISRVNLWLVIFLYVIERGDTPYPPSEQHIRSISPRKPLRGYAFASTFYISSMNVDRKGRLYISGNYCDSDQWFFIYLFLFWEYFLR